MQTTPSLIAARFAHLQPGDLFLFRHTQGACVGIVATDGTQDGDKLFLPIGPTLPGEMAYPTLLGSTGETVISFGGNFTAQLPVDPDDWDTEEPELDITALVVNDSSVFIRCNFHPRPGTYRRAFVDLSNGNICSAGTGMNLRYTEPPGIKAFATRWTFVTTEARPRTILKYGQD